MRFPVTTLPPPAPTIEMGQPAVSNCRVHRKRTPWPVCDERYQSLRQAQTKVRVLHLNKYGQTPHARDAPSLKLIAAAGIMYEWHQRQHASASIDFNGDLRRAIAPRGMLNIMLSLSVVSADFAWKKAELCFSKKPSSCMKFSAMTVPRG